MERDNETTYAPSGGMFDSAKRLVESVVAHLHTRLELFSVEFAEEKLRLTGLLYGVLTAVFLFFVTICLALLFVVAAYWDTPYRLHAIGALIMLSLTCTVIAMHRVRAQLQSRPRLFEASLAELNKDRQQLDSQ